MFKPNKSSFRSIYERRKANPILVAAQRVKKLELLQHSQWMEKQVRKSRRLYQVDVADTLYQSSGTTYVYFDKRSKLRIKKELLAVFYEETVSFIVWEKSTLSWLLRQQGDLPGREVK